MYEKSDVLESRQDRVVSVLRAEHRSLSAVLWSLNYLAREAGTAPDFELFSLMIDYIDLFPERLHHPKEDQHLFTALRMRTTEAEPLLPELTAEHARGAGMIDDLRYALTRYPTRRRAGARAVRGRCPSVCRIPLESYAQGGRGAAPTRPTGPNAGRLARNRRCLKRDQ
jgi:hypothetical protein